MTRAALAVFAACLLAGCAVAEIYRADGTLERREWAVAPVINLGKAPISKVKAAGVIVGNGSATLGYASATMIRPPKDCFAMIFVADAQEARRWADLAAGINGLCKGE